MMMMMKNIHTYIHTYSIITNKKIVVMILQMERYVV